MERKSNIALAIVVAVLLAVILFGCTSKSADIPTASSIQAHCEIYDWQRPSKQDTLQTARTVHNNRQATENLCNVFGVRIKQKETEQ